MGGEEFKWHLLMSQQGPHFSPAKTNDKSTFLGRMVSISYVVFASVSSEKTSLKKLMMMKLIIIIIIIINKLQKITVYWRQKFAFSMKLKPKK